MDAATAVAEIATFQHAYQTLKSVMLINYLFPKQATLKDGDEFDFIISGGGTAGCVLAYRLAAKNFSVLLLEAGDVPPYETFLPGGLIFLMKTRYDWNYTAVEDDYTGKCHRSPAVRISIGKTLGGSSSVNFMLASRGIVHDYQLWAAAANDSSWEFRNLIPYFKRSERLQAPKITNCYIGYCRGVGGTPSDFGEEGGTGNIGIAQDNSTNIKNYLNSFAEMGNEIVQDLSGRHSVGYARALLAIAEGFRQSTAYGYLVPGKKKTNLAVSKNTLVTKIVFDEQKNAIGVEASINGKKPILFRAKKEVIVSAGAIKSPQLLMLSGIGPRKNLEEKNITVISDLPVGENFQDQEAVTVMTKAIKIKPPGPANLNKYPAAAVMGFKSLEPCAGIPDYATISFIEERLNYLLQYCAFPFDFQFEICDRAYQMNLGRQHAYTQVINLYQKSRGRVMLNTTNPHHEPLVYTGSFSNKDDVDNLIEYIKDFLQIVNTTYFKDVDGDRVDPTGNKCSMFEPVTTTGSVMSIVCLPVCGTTVVLVPWVLW